KSSGLRILLDRILRNARNQGWADDLDITIRNDRLVIPMKADFRGRIQGFVQDVSASGNTIFLEPADALPYNNEIRELKIREKNEIRRILTDLTNQLRPHLPEYENFLWFLVQVDLLRSKAQLAIRLQATEPQILEDASELEIIRGKHPLLLLQKQDVIPLGLRLDSQRKILLISGPNAGGKSVALKTTGLLQVMVQTGILVPTDDHSRFPILQKLFVDIGDDQSLQNDLSTYTSHLQMMKQIYDEFDSLSLLLIDEFGTGTDPQQGGPIAEALLEVFEKRRGFGVITTHYSNLKHYAAQSQGVQNGAMLFDLKELKPTYVLQIGLPGSSYAFEIAERTGIPKFIIENAKKKIGSSQVNVEQLLQTLKERETNLATLLNE
ncbi:MAG: endonuclease MutS2, partial [Bacteroidia bacterium]|nr:endonuclease MutS2 [Bacteroidia bacterium]